MDNLCRKLCLTICGQLNKQFSLLFIIFLWRWREGMNNLYGVQNYSNNPLNMQRRDEHFVIRRAFFCAFFGNIFFRILHFKILLWPPGEVLVVLQYAEECSSAFLTQKNFKNQYCVGPTYTNFSRNRASVRGFSSNNFLGALEQILKNFDFWF